MHLFVTFVAIVYGRRSNDPSSKLRSLKYRIRQDKAIKQSSTFFAITFQSDLRLARFRNRLDLPGF